VDRDLLARELRPARPAGHETLHAELLVLGSEQRREVQALDLEPGVEAEVQPGVDRLLAARRASAGPDTNCPANLVAAPYTSASGTTVSTRPIRRASSASTNLPV